MLVRCLYASRAASAVTGALLDEILNQSRRNNPAIGVTGLLCVSGDIFIQVIEGGRDQVCELFNAIARDPRHDTVRLLIYEEIEERRFVNWTMGHVNAAKLNPAMLLKYFQRAELDPFAASGKATMALLTDFYSSGILLKRGD